MKYEVTKKILVDLFAHPLTLIPVVGGLTLLVGSWVLSSAVLAATGLMAGVVGIGIFFTKLVFGLDKITKAAYDKVLLEREQTRNKTLDALDKALQEDRDARPERCLRELRTLYDFLRKEAVGNPLGFQVVDNFDKLFDACVDQIRQTDELWRRSRKLTGNSKKELVQQREQIVQEIEETTKQLATSVNQFGNLGKKKMVRGKQVDSEISELMQELDQTMQVAKRTEERLANLHEKQYDPKEFE